MSAITSSKVGKVLPTATALASVQDSKAAKTVLAELISSHPDASKRSFITNLTREISDLSKGADLLIVIAPKPEPKKK
jgi:hypothetical protein